MAPTSAAAATACHAGRVPRPRPRGPESAGQHSGGDVGDGAERARSAATGARQRCRRRRPGIRRSPPGARAQRWRRSGVGCPRRRRSQTALLSRRHRRRVSISPPPRRGSAASHSCSCDPSLEHPALRRAHGDAEHLGGLGVASPNTSTSTSASSTVGERLASAARSSARASGDDGGDGRRRRQGQPGRAGHAPAPRRWPRCGRSGTATSRTAIGTGTYRSRWCTRMKVSWATSSAIGRRRPGAARTGTPAPGGSRTSDSNAATSPSAAALIIVGSGSSIRRSTSLPAGETPPGGPEFNRSAVELAPQDTRLPGMRRAAEARVIAGRRCCSPRGCGDDDSGPPLLMSASTAGTAVLDGGTGDARGSRRQAARAEPRRRELLVRDDLRRQHRTRGHGPRRGEPADRWTATVDGALRGAGRARRRATRRPRTAACRRRRRRRRAGARAGRPPTSSSSTTTAQRERATTRRATSSRRRSASTASALFVVDYQPGEAPTFYQVRRLDLETRRARRRVQRRRRAAAHDAGHGPNPGLGSRRRPAVHAVHA